jgi:Tol biopolymer transport system component
VAFDSVAANLVAGDANESMDVFVHDLDAGTTMRVSVDSAGVEGDWDSYNPAISAEGTRVAFVSDAANLVDSDGNEMHDIFVHDLATGATSMVNVTPFGDYVGYDEVKSPPPSWQTTTTMPRTSSFATSTAASPPE